MPSSQDSDNLKQLTLFELLEKEPGKPVEWPLRDDDVGGDLLAIFSKGLYPHPLDCIREYVQNAVDAQAKNVTIKITGNSVLIFDDGHGMSVEGLLQARQFGISRKSLTEHVGFRGIGIYSGFDICNRLLITTKRAEDSKSSILEFDFGAMKAEQEKAHQDPSKPRTSLTDLISSHSHFWQDPDDLEKHYTMVLLEDISDTHIDQLADRENLRRYILRNLPIDFADDFLHKGEIFEHIRKYIRGYNAAKIILEFDTAPRELVYRPNIPNLHKPELGAIYNAKGERIACFWACLHIMGERIPEQYADYRGFVYKVRGFTIGDNHRLQGYFKKGSATLYRWYMGEIFVLDHNVRPNAARDDFETSLAKSQLEIGVQEKLTELENVASDYQKQMRADAVLESSAAKLKTLEEKIESQRYDSFQVFSDLEELIQNLEAQKKNTSNKRNADDLIQHAQKLQRTARNKTVNDPPERPKRPKKSPPVPPPPPSSFLFPDISYNTSNNGQEKVGTASAGESVSYSTSEPSSASSDSPLNGTPSSAPDGGFQSPRTLMHVFENAGWDVTGECVQLMKVLDTSLSDVFVRGSDAYNRLLDDIEVKLSNGSL